MSNGTDYYGDNILETKNMKKQFGKIKILITVFLLFVSCGIFAQASNNIKISPQVNAASKKLGYLGSLKYKGDDLSIGGFLYGVKTGKIRMSDGIKHVFYYRWKCDHLFKSIQILKEHVLYSFDISVREDPESNKSTDETFTILLKKRKGFNYMTGQQLSQLDGLYYAFIGMTTYQTELGDTNTVPVFKSIDDELKNIMNKK